MTDLGLELIISTRRITAGVGIVSKFMGIVHNDSVLYCDSTIDVDFLVMPELPFHEIIGFPTKIELGTCTDIGNPSDSVYIDGRIVKMPLDFYKSIHAEDLRKKDTKYLNSSYDIEG